MNTINCVLDKSNGHLNNIIGYDIIRIISTFMVVVIHSNVTFLTQNLGSIEWIIVMQSTALCVISVPLFFMISGALLLDCEKPVSIKVLFHKRVYKQFVPFFIWSLIYTFIRILTQKVSFELSTFTDLFHEPAYYQFWFMYTLLAIYLILPALQSIVCNLNRSQLEYILLIWFIFCVFLPLLEKCLPFFVLSEHVDLVLCEGYVGYFILGFYLKKFCTDVPIKIASIVSIIGFFITGVASIIEWKYAYISGSIYIGYAYRTYLLPGVVISVIGVFIMLQNYKFKNTCFCKLISDFSKLSLGIFYIHMLVLLAFEYCGFLGLENIYICVIKSVLIFGISAILIRIIKRNRSLNKYLLGQF